MRRKEMGKFLKQHFDKGVRLNQDPFFQKKKERLALEAIPWENSDQPQIIQVNLSYQRIWVWLLNQDEDPEGAYIKVRNQSEESWAFCSLDQFITRCKSIQQHQQSGVLLWLEQQKVPYEPIPGQPYLAVHAGSRKMYLAKGYTEAGLIPVSFELHGKTYHYSSIKLAQLIATRTQKEQIATPTLAFAE